jgi:cell division protein FtsB
MLIILVLLGAIGYKLFTPAVADLRQQEAVRMGLEAELLREKQEKSRIRQEISWIESETDTGYLESLIKDKLDYKSPEESIIRLETAPEPGDPTREQITVIHDPRGLQPPAPETETPPAPE